MSTSGWDAIVVGSGLGGLSAAAHLAATGQRTLVLERYEVIGGSSHVFRRRGRWEADCGVHYIGDCGPGGQLPTLFHGLGLDDRIQWLPLDTGGFDTIVGPDLQLRVPAGWDAYLENLLATFPGEERALRRFVAIMRRLGHGIDRSVTPSSRAAMLRYVRACGPAASWLATPYIAVLAACGLKPRTIMALSVQCGALAGIPQTMSTMAMAGFFQNFVGDGAYYPRGGGQMLSAAFADVVQTHGGAVRTDAEVDRILVEAGRVTGVRLAGGEEIRSPVVVSDADIIRTYRDLVGYEHLPWSLATRAKRWKMSWPLINAVFGVEIDVTDTPNSNFYAIPSWDDTTSLLRMHRMTSQLLFGADRRDPVDWASDFARRQVGFVQCSTRRDPHNTRSAPPGNATIEVQTIAPSNLRLWGADGIDGGGIAGGDYRRRDSYREVKQIVTDGLLQRIEQVYPGAAGKVVWSELGTPATQERFTHTSGGNAFGLACRPSQYGPLRPGTTTPIAGLFLAGTSTAWGPGTEGAMLSGLHAASAITGRDLQSEILAGTVLTDRARLTDWPADFDPLTASRGLGRKQTATDQAMTVQERHA
ncbi:phytoene desaturase family protein [Mycobacterium talmoniae]|uniref:All-trans-zeta-carotene desaturase n=1 Tax=Mycobacterium talmoniae TaxID=1858794 RepID=A0A1S1NIR2_9MYCO|nr:MULTISPECIES: NAD(P)/FAD-dependent oxidoreductase [Mycobacterium]OHV01446.1 FAD-dependent oxidoreductase [Mycobacterium talmoniae]PQM48301.1 All-trans-zeta-carotene desaturase [Mycobacterium talmoniae]TDH48195.1 NAD(P)/FAD-dependent oxidoreductase [Mycobacterium eburneum]